MKAYRRIIDCHCSLPEDCVSIKEVKLIHPERKVLRASLGALVYAYSFPEDWPSEFHVENGTLWFPPAVLPKWRTKWRDRFAWLIDIFFPRKKMIVKIEYVSTSEYNGSDAVRRSLWFGDDQNKEGLSLMQKVVQEIKQSQDLVMSHYLEAEHRLIRQALQKHLGRESGPDDWAKTSRVYTAGNVGGKHSYELVYDNVKLGIVKTTFPSADDPFTFKITLDSK